jgi:hypothetical protein
MGVGGGTAGSGTHPCAKGCDRAAIEIVESKVGLATSRVSTADWWLILVARTPSAAASARRLGR